MKLPHLILPLFFFLLFASPAAEAADALYQFCRKTDNYTANSTYEANLQTLFTDLWKINNSSTNFGFAKTSVGSTPNLVSGLVLCRGDVNFTACSSCLNQATQDIQNLCPYNKEATIYYDYCLLRYSNQNFLSSTDNSDQIIMYNTKNVSVSFSLFDNFVDYLMNSTANYAAFNDSKKFGTSQMNSTDSFPVIMGLVQCTPDMSGTDCNSCLQNLIDQMPKWFSRKQGGRIIGVRCNIRYGIYSFYSGAALLTVTAPAANAPAPAPSPPPRVTNPPSEGRKIRHLIIIVSVSVALLIIGCFIVFLLIRKLKYAETEISQEERMLATNNETLNQWNCQRSPDFSLFDFSQIANATGNFSLDNKLGEGGFGPVYKGQLQDGLEIAVKRLSSNSGQGLVEFKNEIQLIAKLQHRNLVRLVGWCIKEEEKILVYEYMPNKSLDCFIFDKTSRGALLNWERRFEIIEGIAQGLLYLHQYSRLKIVHRDVKASNILLDSEMNPKISDFGLARIFGSKELQANTNRVVGTYGYMAPEYASEGRYSIKSDVFSFGVLLLEIVSGKRNMGFHQYEDFLNLLGYAWDRWKGGKFSELICPTLTEVSQRQIERCIHVALLCVQEKPVDRPIMSDVIMFLTTESIILPEPKQPAYFNVRVIEETVESSDINGSSCSINYVTLTNPQER